VPAGGVLGELPLAKATETYAVDVMLSPMIVSDFPAFTASDVRRMVGI
jgi:hypothetical protein